MKRNLCIILLAIAIPIILKVGFRPKYQTSKEWQNMFYAIEDFARDRAKQLGMRFLFAGDDSRAEEAYVGFSLTDTKNVAFDQGKSIAQQLSKDFVAFIRTTPCIQAIVLEMNKQRRNPELYEQFLMKNTSFRIAFRNKEMDRPKAPYLAEIQFYEGKIHYYEADPVTQALKEIHEDPYME